MINRKQYLPYSLLQMLKFPFFKRLISIAWWIPLHFLYPFIYWWTGWFYVMAIVNTAAKSIYPLTLPHQLIQAKPHDLGKEQTVRSGEVDLYGRKQKLKIRLHSTGARGSEPASLQLRTGSLLSNTLMLSTPMTDPGISKHWRYRVERGECNYVCLC